MLQGDTFIRSWVYKEYKQPFLIGIGDKRSIASRDYSVELSKEPKYNYQRVFKKNTLWHENGS